MGDIPITLFNYTETRSGNEAYTLLSGYTGYFETDDYAGYNKAVKKNELQPQIKGRQKITAACPEQRFHLRLTKSIPLFKRFIRWVELKLAKVTGKSTLGKALSYFLRNKEKLIMYCCDQKLNIDSE